MFLTKEFAWQNTRFLPVPVLRFGRGYESMESVEVKDCRSGEALVQVSQANAGLIRKDLSQKAAAARKKMREIPTRAGLKSAQGGRQFSESIAALADG